MDLFEKVRNWMQCQYISDIRIGSNLNIAKEIVASLDFGEYPLRELQDMTQYLYGGSYKKFKKEEIIALLKAQKNDCLCKETQKVS